MIRRLATAMIAAGLALGPLGAGRAAAAFSLTADAYTLDEDVAHERGSEDGVLANDVTDEGALCVTAYGPLADQGHGTLELTPNGAFVFTPEGNFNGTATWTYNAKPCDTTVELPPQTTITFTVSPVNDPPTAQADSFAALRNTTLNIAAPGILANDADVDGDSLTAVLDTTTTHGVLTLAANGSFSYTPDTGYTGPDAFSYHAHDGTASSSPPRVVKLTVSAVATPRPTTPPTAAPTTPPTAPPTAPPTEAPTAEPSPSPSLAPSPSVDPNASAAASASAGVPSPVPSPTADPEPSDSGGVSTPVLVVAALFLFLLAFGLSVFVPRWLRQQRTGEPMDDL